MIERILVTLDGSPFAEAALPPAVSLARRTGASVGLVMVQDPIPAYSFGEFDERPQEWRKTYLAKVAERVEAEVGSSVEHSLRLGAVTVEIDEHVERSNPDLVVMATHGRGPFSRFWLGSVADHVVRHVDRPLLLIRPDENGDAADQVDPSDDRTFEHIVIPLDGSDEAESILEPTLEFGKAFGARYTLVRIVHYPAEIVSSYLPDTVRMGEEIVEAGMAEAESYVEEVAAELRQKGFDVATDVRVEVHPASGIADAAEEVGAQLVAMATHGRGGVERAIMGSVADKLVRSSHLPTLVLRPTAE